MHRRVLFSSLLLIVLASTAALAASTDGRWLHIRVEEAHDDESVSINVPLSLVASLLPLVETDEFRGGRIRIDDHWDDDGIDLREVLDAVREAPDAEFITIRERDEVLRVSKDNGYLLVRTDERGGADDEVVNIRLPLAVVNAMFARDDEIDLMAGLEALADHSDGDLVMVRDGDETVRIWIDSSEHGR
jgi:hypothetical protein